MTTPKVKILFLCTGNSCRSQMAEGWARALKSDVLEPYSAGIETHGLNPNAVKVMAEVGVDLSRQRSKHVDELALVPFDIVVTVCGHAHEHCPLFPGQGRVIHVGFDDPPKLAKSAPDAESALDCYRRVRDEIKAFILTLPGSLNQPDSGVPGIEDASAHFNQAAATWDESPMRAALSQAVADGIRAAVPLNPAWHALEYGCGTATLSVLLHRELGQIVAADTATEMLEQARRKLADRGIERISPQRLDLTREPAPRPFDFLFSAMTLHHIADTPALFRAFANSVVPGGWIALADLQTEDGSFHPDMIVPHHGFDPDQLATLLATAGFTAPAWRIIHLMERNQHTYPIFLLTAQRLPSA